MSFPDRIRAINVNELGIKSSLAIESPSLKGHLRFSALGSCVAIAALFLGTTCIRSSYEVGQVIPPSVPIIYSLSETQETAPSSNKETIPASSHVAVKTAETPFLTGVNMPAVLNWPETDIDVALKEIRRMNGSLVRVFAGNNQLSDEESAEKLNSFLKKADRYGIQVIPAFVDYHGGPWDRKSMTEAYINAACPKEDSAIDVIKDTIILCKDRIKSWDEVKKEILIAGYGNGFNPKGTDQFYIREGKYGILNKDFFSTGYKGRYKDFVKYIVQSTRQNPNIWAWEVGNELRAEGDVFINFMKDMAATIRDIDPHRRIATGMSDSKLANLTPQQLYPKIDFDVVTVHAYEGSRVGLADVKWALDHGKIPLIEEIGFWGEGNRTRKMEIETKFWKDVSGAGGILPWGFVPPETTVKQPGDNGFSSHYRDYDTIFELFKSLSNPSSSSRIQASS